MRDVSAPSPRYEEIRRRLDAGEVIDPSGALVRAGKAVLRTSRETLASVTRNMLHPLGEPDGLRR